MNDLDKLTQEQDSVIASANFMLETLLQLRNNYQETGDTIRTLERRRGSYIKSSESLINTYNVKLSKKIENYDLSELQLLYSELNPNIPYKDRERIMSDCLLINTINQERIKLEQKLEEYKIEMFETKSGKDKDYKDELVLTLTPEETISNIEEQELGEAAKLHKDLITEVKIALQEKEETEEDSPIEEVIVEEEETTYLDSLLETKDFSAEDASSYSIEPDKSFIDIVLVLYGDATNWNKLYHLGNNKNIIDERLNGKKIEDVLYDSNIFTGLEIEIPHLSELYDQSIKTK